MALDCFGNIVRDIESDTRACEWSKFALIGLFYLASPPPPSRSLSPPTAAAEVKGDPPQQGCPTWCLLILFRK